MTPIARQHLSKAKSLKKEIQKAATQQGWLLNKKKRIESQIKDRENKHPEHFKNLTATKTVQHFLIMIYIIMLYIIDVIFCTSLAEYIAFASGSELVDYWVRFGLPFGIVALEISIGTLLYQEQNKSRAEYDPKRVLMLKIAGIALLTIIPFVIAASIVAQETFSVSDIFIYAGVFVYSFSTHWFLVFSKTVAETISFFLCRIFNFFQGISCNWNKQSLDKTEDSISNKIDKLKETMNELREIHDVEYNPEFTPKTINVLEEIYGYNPFQKDKTNAGVKHSRGEVSERNMLDFYQN